VTDHLVRRCLYLHITANPGVHYNALKSTLGLTDGVLSHHLHVLEKVGAVVSRNERNRRCFYPTARGYPARGMDRLTDMQAGILYHVQLEQGITQGELAGRLGVSKQDLNYHLRELCADKLVYRRRVSRNTHFYVDPGRLARDLL
jgi:predicted transcriptional regulator